MLTLLFGMAAALSGQESSAKHYWNRGLLTWDDFQPVVVTRSEEHSYLEFNYEVSSTAYRHGAVTTGFPEAYVYVDRKQSWVDTCFMNVWELRYNQVVFDIAEMYRRLLQQRLDESTCLKAGQLVDSIFFKAEACVDTFVKACRYGTDTAEVLRWESRIVSRLMSLPALSRMRECDNVLEVFEDYPEKMGGWVDGCFGFFPDGLSRYFTPMGGVSLGLELAYRRHDLSFGLDILGSRCRMDALSTISPVKDLLAGDELTSWSLQASYGVAAVERSRIRITPFVGVAFHKMYVLLPDYSSAGASAASFRAGVNLQWHLSNTLFDTGHEYVSLNLRVFATHERFGSVQGSPSGHSVNVQLGFSFLRNEVMRKPLKP